MNSHLFGSTEAELLEAGGWWDKEAVETPRSEMAEGGRKIDFVLMDFVMVSCHHFNYSFNSTAVVMMATMMTLDKEDVRPRRGYGDV